MAGPRGGPGVTQSIAQTFTAGLTGTLEGVALNLAKDTASDPLVVELRDVGADGAPGGTVLSQTYLGAEQVRNRRVAASRPVGSADRGHGLRDRGLRGGGLGLPVERREDRHVQRRQGLHQYASPPASAWTTSAGDRASGRTSPPRAPSRSSPTRDARRGRLRRGFAASGRLSPVWRGPPQALRPLDRSFPVHCFRWLGDTMTATISDLAPAQTLRVCMNVGGAGSSGAGGPGGGASGVSLGSDFSSPVVIGGGGGATSSQSALGAVRGGNAGWPAGVDGEGSQPGRGGTQSVAGGGGEPGSATTAAGPGGGGAGTDVYSGGGGGGWFGGGSGNDVSSIVVLGSGGGGGSDYCAAFAALCSRTPGGSGPAGVTLTYTVAETAVAPTIARPTGAPFGTAATAVPLAVLSFTQSARRWRASRSARRKARVGTTFRFELNRPAKATLTFYRSSSKRRLGAQTRIAPAGASRIRFTGAGVRSPAAEARALHRGPRRDRRHHTGGRQAADVHDRALITPRAGTSGLGRNATAGAGLHRPVERPQREPPPARPRR